MNSLLYFFEENPEGGDLNTSTTNNQKLKYFCGNSTWPFKKNFVSNLKKKSILGNFNKNQNIKNEVALQVGVNFFF